MMRCLSHYPLSPPTTLFLPLHLNLPLSNLAFRNQTLRRRLRRRIRSHNLALNLAHSVLWLENAHHAQQPPRRIARLRAYTYPIPCARDIESDVFPWPPVCVTRSRGLGFRIVRSEDFERAGIARCSGCLSEGDSSLRFVCVAIDAMEGLGE